MKIKERAAFVMIACLLLFAGVVAAMLWYVGIHAGT
jgi:hypothetical protein